MARKLFLPITPGEGAGLPTVDVVRKRLGGRASTEAGAGEIVRLVEDRADRIGVVLFARGDEVDVWLSGGLVRRVRREGVRGADPGFGGAPSASDEGERMSDELVAVARDARAFGALAERQPVRYQHEGGTGRGALVEKCRFGALIERSDGVVLGVGFRRVWASVDHDAN